MWAGGSTSRGRGRLTGQLAGIAAGPRAAMTDPFRGLTGASGNAFVTV
jgi:hypothetical protein